MDESVSVKLLFTPDDSLRIAQFIRNQSFLYRYDAFLTAGVVFFAFIIAIVLMADDAGTLRILGATVFSAIPAIVVGLAVFGLHKLVNPWLMRRSIAKHFKASPTAKEQTTMTFSDNGIHFESTFESGTSKWTVITKVKETNTDFLFYSGKSLLYFLPKRSLESAERLQKLRVVIDKTVGEKAQLH